MKINTKSELRNIVINHSADIDYNEFLKIYRECTKESYSFLTADIKLLATDLPRFRKKLFPSHQNRSNLSN